MNYKIFNVELFGMNLSFRDFEKSNTIDTVVKEFKKDVYGLEKISLTEEDCIIDVGANIGIFSIYAKKKFNCKIIAFEPILENFENFKYNVELNGLQLSDFELHQKAITATDDEEIKISVVENNSGGSSAFLATGSVQACKTERLGKFINPNCKYLKIDCEGGEYEIIPDIADKLNNFEYIGIEYHKYSPNQDPKKLHRFLKENFSGKIFVENQFGILNEEVKNTWEHDLQVSIHAYYVNELDAGARSADRLMNNPNIPDNIRFQAQKNSCFYMKPISSYEGVKLNKINIPKFKSNWNLFNPTVINFKNKIYGLVRSSNYNILNNINYVPPPEDDGIIKTEWCLVEFNNNLEILNYRWMNKPIYNSNNGKVRGIEDCRLFSIDDKLYVSSTVCDVSPYNTIPRISVSSVNLDSASFDDIIVLQGIDSNRCEKNWMPIQYCDKFPEWIYMCEHNGNTILTRYQDNVNKFKYLDSAPKIGKTFRGSSQLIKYNKGYIGIVHEVAFFEENRRVYYHRIVEFDSEKRMINCSLPFFLKENMVIEFCNGITWKDDDLLISFGVRDIEPWIATVPMHVVNNLLSRKI